jgi:hypothetical protein
MRKALVVLTLLTFAALVSSLAYAQDGTTGSGEFLSAAEEATLRAGLPDLPAGGDLIGIGTFSGFNDYTVDNLDIPCEQAVVYKISPQRVLDRWTKTACVDGQFILRTEGDADFVFFNFGSAANTANAPVRAATYTLNTSLTGAAERPGPGDTDARGSFSATVDLALASLCYNLTASNLETPTAAHIHIGGPTVPGPIVIPLRAPANGSSSGCIENADPNVLIAILNDPAGYYANVHNATFPAGATRGQLARGGAGSTGRAAASTTTSSGQTVTTPQATAEAHS